MDNESLAGPRPARLSDREAILDTLNLIFRTAAGRPPTVALDHPQVYLPENLPNVMIMTSGSQVVASTAVMPIDIRMGDVCLRVAGINCVGVLPEYRRFGLGRRIMDAAASHARRLGCHVGLLATDIDNWYRDQGWERAGSKRAYRIDLGNVSLLPDLPLGVATASAGYDRLEDVLRLHHTDRLGAIRTPDLSRTTLAGKKSPALLLAEKDGQALAYLLTRDTTVIEWGGAAELVAGLVKAFFNQSDQPSVSTSRRDAAFKAARLQYISVISPGAGHPFVSYLDQRRIVHQNDYIGMLRVLDPAGTLAAFGNAGISVTERAGAFEVSDGKNSVTLTPNHLAKFLFGPERVCAIAPDAVPLPFWQWPLEIV